MKGPQDAPARQIYRTPKALLLIYYSVVTAWTIVSIVFIGGKTVEAGGGDLVWLGMIAFVLGFTWYFSLGVFYRIQMGPEGEMELTSFRRVLTTHPREIEAVEGPFLPVGFVRFKLPGERAYLMCILTNPVLRGILKRIGEMNLEVKFKTR
ncbi:MAG: hypothetical protein ACUVXD_03890 [Thermodesulfobacteriota bacterium]